MSLVFSETVVFEPPRTGLNPKFDLDAITEGMVDNIEKHLNELFENCHDLMIFGDQKIGYTRYHAWKDAHQLRKRDKKAVFKI